MIALCRTPTFACDTPTADASCLNVAHPFLIKHAPTLATSSPWYSLRICTQRSVFDMVVGTCWHRGETIHTKRKFMPAELLPLKDFEPGKSHKIKEHTQIFALEAKALSVVTIWMGDRYVLGFVSTLRYPHSQNSVLTLQLSFGRDYNTSVYACKKVTHT